MGISSVLVFLSGKITALRFRPISGEISQGQSVATIESIKYVGAVRSPIAGKLSALNCALSFNSTLLWKNPYESWIAEFDSFSEKSLDSLLRGKGAKDALASRIKELRIRCFKLLPDEEMYSIGTECATTLANVDELLTDKLSGYALHLVTDDPTADLELVRWSMQTGNELVETRKEDNLFHFIIKKS